MGSREKKRTVPAILVPGTNSLSVRNRDRSRGDSEAILDLIKRTNHTAKQPNPARKIATIMLEMLALIPRSTAVSQANRKRVGMRDGEERSDE